MVGAVMTMAGYSVLAEISKCVDAGKGRTQQNSFAFSRAHTSCILLRTRYFSTLADTKFLFKEEIVPGHVNKFTII